MSTGGFSEEELRQAAAEAGISPQELRVALAERDGTVAPANKRASAIVPRRASPVKQVESSLAMPPREAIGAVRSSIEKQTGLRGHQQGDGRADIVDDGAGLTYRILSETDGAGGSLVRVEVDSTTGRGAQALATTGVVGITATLIALGWLFGALTLVFGGAAVGVLGGLLIGRNALRLMHATNVAQGTAAQALLDAEERLALPPASGAR
jgi:hypothetical protein